MRGQKLISYSSLQRHKGSRPEGQRNRSAPAASWLLSLFLLLNNYSFNIY